MSNRYAQGSLSPRQACERQYLVARSNLLLLIVFTAINLILLVTNANTYFLFSASIPYYIVTMGMYMCGRFPADYYADEIEGFIFLDNSVFVVTLILAIIIILLYLLAWFMSSKNRVGWLKFAFVLFVLDTVGMLFIFGLSINSVLDILFHAWVIYYLVVGIRAHKKLMLLPPDEGPLPFTLETPENVENAGEESAPTYQNSPILRPADMSVKHKVLLQVKIHDLDICYRRVRSTNELVINGNVYAEREGVIEVSHTLFACVNGHNISAGLYRSYSVIAVDGMEVARKLRLI